MYGFYWLLFLSLYPYVRTYGYMYRRNKCHRFSVFGRFTGSWLLTSSFDTIYGCHLMIRWKFSFRLDYGRCCVYLDFCTVHFIRSGFSCLQSKVNKLYRSSVCVSLSVVLSPMVLDSPPPYPQSSSLSNCSCLKGKSYYFFKTFTYHVYRHVVVLIWIMVT